MTFDINIMGDITPDLPKRINDMLHQLPTEATKLRVNINSGGGGVTFAVTVYNILKRCRVPVETHNMGEVSSAAILVYLAGSVRTAEPVFKFMFHPFSISAEGSMSVADVMEKIHVLESDLKNYVKIVEKESPAFVREYDVTGILKHQTVIITDPSEALRLGIITPPAGADEQSGNRTEGERTT